MYWIQPCQNGAEDHGMPPNQELQVAYPWILQFTVHIARERILG